MVKCPKCKTEIVDPRSLAARRMWRKRSKAARAAIMAKVRKPKASK